MSAKPTEKPEPPGRLIPVFVDARREGLQILIAWAIAMVWTVGCCWFLGYRSPGDRSQLEVIAGVPSWVFWGVVLPWVASSLWTLYYSLFVMKDNSLSEHEPPSESDD